MAAKIDGTLVEITGGIENNAVAIDASGRLKDAGVPPGGGGGGGVSDHGALSGLADDDHAQYHNDARGDARYAAVAHVTDTGNPHAVTAAQIGVEEGATADQTDAEIEAAYNARVPVVSQAEAEEGVATTVARWTAERVRQAIAAIAFDSVVSSFAGRTGAVGPADGDYSGIVTNQPIRSENKTLNAAGAAGPFDFAGKTTKRWILTGNITGSLNPPTGLPLLVAGQSVDWEFTFQQDGVGGHTVSQTLWSNPVFQVLGGVPQVDTAPNAETKIVGTAYHNGTSVQHYVFGEQGIAAIANNLLTRTPKFAKVTTANLPADHASLDVIFLEIA